MRLALGRLEAPTFEAEKGNEKACLAILNDPGKRFTVEMANNVDLFGRTALIAAAAVGLDTVCGRLLEENSFVNVNNADKKTGKTALHYLVENEMSEEVILKLIR